MKAPQSFCRSLNLIPVLLLAFASSAYGVPGSISYQGFLTDTAGSPVSGVLDIGVRLYDMSGATLLYDETHGGVDVQNGMFTLAIGTGTPIAGNLDPGLFSGANAAGQLELVIEGETLSPRRPLRSVPYSQAAHDANELGGTPPEGFVQLESDDVQSIAGGALVIDGSSGDVETSGDYRYQSPRTHIHTITPERFIPVWIDRDQWRIQNANVSYRHSTDGAIVDAHAGLNLPAQARPVKMNCYFYDNSFAAAITFMRATLQSRGPANLSPGVPIGEIIADSTFPTSSAAMRVASTDLSQTPVTAGRPMLIALSWTTSGTASNLRFYGCDVEYTVDQVGPG